MKFNEYISYVPFLSSYLGRKVLLENENLKYIGNIYNLTDILSTSKQQLYINGKYFIIGGEYFFHQFPASIDLNNINKEVYNRGIDKILDTTSLGLKEIYKYFVHIDKPSFLSNKPKQKINKLLNLEFTRARGNIFEFQFNGNKYKMFGYSIPVDKISFFRTHMDLPYIILAEINLYNPEIFLLEALLYFYVKNKGVFLGERIKLINYIKSIGINLENFAINIKHDEYFLNKVIRLASDDLFYKYFLLLKKEVGTVGYINLNAYVFALDEGKHITPVTPVVLNGEKLMFLGDQYERMVYIDYIKKYNETLSQTSYNYSLWFNYNLMQDIAFYSYDNLESVVKFLLNKQ